MLRRDTLFDGLIHHEITTVDASPELVGLMEALVCQGKSADSESLQNHQACGTRCGGLAGGRRTAGRWSFHDPSKWILPGI